MNAYKRWLSAKKYQAKVNLLNHIHEAIQPALLAMRQADSLLERTTRDNMGITAQGYCCLIGSKYQGHTYGTGTIEPNLASVNDPFNAVRQTAMNKASENTRGIDNSLALQSA